MTEQFMVFTVTRTLAGNFTKQILGGSLNYLVWFNYTAVSGLWRLGVDGDKPGEDELA